PRLGHRVHGCGDDRQIELDRPGEAGFEAHFTRQGAGMSGDERHIVEGPGPSYDSHADDPSQKNYYTRALPARRSARARCLLERLSTRVPKASSYAYLAIDNERYICCLDLADCDRLRCRPPGLLKRRGGAVCFCARSVVIGTGGGARGVSAEGAVDYGAERA